jgi:hypothetical protein
LVLMLPPPSASMQWNAGQLTEWAARIARGLVWFGRLR